MFGERPDVLQLSTQLRYLIDCVFKMPHNVGLLDLVSGKADAVIKSLSRLWWEVISMTSQNRIQLSLSF